MTHLEHSARRAFGDQLRQPLLTLSQNNFERNTSTLKKARLEHSARRAFGDQLRQLVLLAVCKVAAVATWAGAFGQIGAHACVERGRQDVVPAGKVKVVRIGSVCTCRSCTPM